MEKKPITIVGIPSLQAESRRVSEIIEMIRNHPKNISGFVKSLGFKELAGYKLFALEKTGSVSGALIIKQSDNVNKIAEVRLIFKNFNLSEDDIDAIRQIIEDLLPEYTKIRMPVEENDYDITGVLKKIGFVFESGLPAEIFTSLGYKNAQSFVYCTAPDRKIIDISQEKTSSTDDQKKNILLEERLEKIQEILGNKNIEAGIKAFKAAIADKNATLKTADTLIKELEKEIAELKQKLTGKGSVPERPDKLSELIVKIGNLSDEVKYLEEELRKKNKEIADLRNQKPEAPQNCEEKIAELERQLTQKSNQIVNQAKEIERLKSGEKTPEEVPEKTDPEQKTADDNTAGHGQSDDPEKTKKDKESSVSSSESPAISEETLKTDSPINAIFAMLEERIKDQDLNGFITVADMKKILQALFKKDNNKILLANLDFNELGFNFLQAKAMCEKLKLFGIIKIDNPGSLFRIRFTDEIANLLEITAKQAQ